MNTSKIVFSIFWLTLIAFGCQGFAQPTKERLVSELKTVYELLSKGDNAAAAEHFKGPDGVTKEKMASELTRLLEIQEISAKGIEILDQHGIYGKLSEVFPERAAIWMGRIGITDAENCYGLGLGGAQVAAYWDGKKFLIFRLDDVGKLVKPQSGN